jgi:hypothetical protein
MRIIYVSSMAEKLEAPVDERKRIPPLSLLRSRSILKTGAEGITPSLVKAFTKIVKAFARILTVQVDSECDSKVLKIIRYVWLDRICMRCFNAN